MSVVPSITTDPAASTKLVGADSSSDSKYSIVRVIRNTIFGRLAIAQSKETRQLVALKMSSLARLQEAHASHSNPENPVEEARLLKQLADGTGGPGHRNIIRLLDEYVLDGTHYAALELADQGDLFAVIERHGRLSEDVVRKVFLQMIAGVRYLHDCGVAHLDLKPENLLFTSAGEIKICDFGMARVVAPSRFKAAAIASTSAAASSEMKALDFKPKTVQGAVGTVMYMAPEVFAGQPFDPFAADVYSLGVILFLLLTGGHAYHQPTARDARFSMIYSGRQGLVRLLSTLGQLQLLSESAVDIMSRMMCEPSERASLQELLAHPWMAPTVAQAHAAAAAVAKQQQMATAQASAPTAQAPAAAPAAAAAAASAKLQTSPPQSPQQASRPQTPEKMACTAAKTAASTVRAATTVSTAPMLPVAIAAASAAVASAKAAACAARAAAAAAAVKRDLSSSSSDMDLSPDTPRSNSRSSTSSGSSNGSSKPATPPQQPRSKFLFSSSRPRFSFASTATVVAAAS